MFYILQANISKDKKYLELPSVLDRLGLEYEICRFIPFIGEIEFTTKRKDVFVFGSMSYISDKYGFNPGSLTNDNHNMILHMEKYGSHMLNGDGTIIEFGDRIPDNIPDVFFIRPTTDGKVFAGKLYSRESWNEYVNECIENDSVKDVKEQTKILVSSPKEIYQEIRCWIVGNKVASMSQYKIGSRVTSKNLDYEDPEALDFATKMIDIYRPAEAFCLDICRTDQGFKIVEINNINSSGFYDVDLNRLILSLESHFNPNYGIDRRDPCIDYPPVEI